MQLHSLQSYKNKAVPTAALLFVYVDSAHSLPVSTLSFSPLTKFLMPVIVFLCRYILESFCFMMLMLFAEEVGIIHAVFVYVLLV